MSTDTTRPAAACLDRFTQLPDTLLSVLSPRQHQVIHLLLSYRWTDDAPIYPSIPTMAARLNCSDRTIQRTIRQLEVRGYLVVVAQHRSDRSQQSNLYQPGPMLLPLLPPLGDGGATERRARVTGPVTSAPPKRYPVNRYTPTRSRERLYGRIPQAASAYLETRSGPLRRR